MNGISVIIPTHNRKKSLARCLEGIQNGSILPNEVVVVNDCSHDGTREFLDENRSELIHVIHSEKRLGKSEARNTGIRASVGSIIAFIDDDCVPDKFWLERLHTSLVDSQIDFAIGSIVYVDKTYRGHFPERIVQNKNALWPMTASIIYRKRVFLDIGFFDSTYDALDKEDLEFAVRACSRGLSYASVPAAVVVHEKSFWSLAPLLNSARNGSIWPILKKRYPEQYRTFHAPLLGAVAQPQDYVLLIFLPILIIPLFMQYWRRGNRSLGLFFAKWPLFFILKRLFIYWESIRQKKFII